MNDELRNEISDEELEEVVGGKKKSKGRAKKSKYKCLECMKGNHIGLPDMGSYIYFLDGKTSGEGYCKRGHHWNRLESYDRFDLEGAKKWFSQHS